MHSAFDSHSPPYLTDITLIGRVDIALALVEDAEIEFSGSELSSSDDEESSRQIEAALLSGNTVRFSSMGQSGPGGRRDKKEKKRIKKGKGKWESGSSDDEMFDGNGTWADDDDDYVRGVQVSSHTHPRLRLKLTIPVAEYIEREFSSPRLWESQGSQQDVQGDRGWRLPWRGL